MRVFVRSCLTAVAFALALGCGAAKDAAEDAGVPVPEGEGLDDLTKMKFSGFVKKPDGTPIEGATVRFIQLLDIEAIKQLIEYKKVPDGNGGEKDAIRIKFDKIHPYAATYETTTDASGAFEMKADIQLYLVYVFGPGPAPGQPGSYSVAFWGINTTTGELDMDNLIGVDKKLEQVNNGLTLAGGPTPPPPPAAQPAPPAPPAPPEPTAEAVNEELAAPPEPPPEPATETAEPPETEAAPEPTTADAATSKEEVIPPTPAEFFKSVSLFEDTTYKLGYNTGAEGEEYESDDLTLSEGKKYFMIKGEVSAAPEGPVYLVLQEGFDSEFVEGCAGIKSAAKTHIFPIKANGTKIEYKFVPPGAYYKFFLAKTASKAEGAAVEATEPSKTIRVGTKKCDNAIPKRKFMATLTWDTTADLDLHVTKVDRAKFAADQADTAAIKAESNWMNPNQSPSAADIEAGKTVSLDVDNVSGYGPENNGESPDVESLNDYCYVVKAHYYSGSGATKAKVNITHVLYEPEDKAKPDGPKNFNVKKQTFEKELTEPSKEWWTVGVFPKDCTEAPPKKPVKEPAPTGIAGLTCDPSTVDTELALGSDEKSGIKATLTLADNSATYNFECKYKEGRRYVSGGSTSDGSRYWGSFSSARGFVADTASLYVSCTAPGYKQTLNFRINRAPKDGTEFDADVDRREFPNAVFRVNSYGDTRFRLTSKAGWGRNSGSIAFKEDGGGIKLASSTLDDSGRRYKTIKGCGNATWVDGSSDYATLTTYFNLNF